MVRLRVLHGTYETDLRRFPARTKRADWRTGSGFVRVEQRVVERIVDHKMGREMLEDPFLGKRACSQLALLTEEAYAAGPLRIETALARAEVAGERFISPTSIQLTMTVGKKGWTGSRSG